MVHILIHFGIEYFVTKKEATAVMLLKKLKHTLICFWYLAFVITYNAAFEIFEGKVRKNTNTSAIEFTCKTDQRPVGDSIVFLLNDITTNVMRVYDGKCYDNHGECKNCTCSFSRNEISFTWMYVMTVPCHNCTFGADMSFSDEKKRKTRNVNLYRVYNCKDLGPLQMNSQDVQHNTNQEEGMKEDGFVVPIISIFVTAIVTCSIIIIMIFVLRKRKQNRQRLRHQVREQDTEEGLLADRVREQDTEEGLLADRVKEQDTEEGLLADRVKKQDPEEDLLANTGIPHLSCALCKPVQITVQLARQITLNSKSNVFGLISISKSKLVVANNFENTLDIYLDGQCNLKRNVIYRINGVTRVSEDVIAVTHMNRKEIDLYTLKNQGCEKLDKIVVGFNIVDIASDKDYLVFEQKNENTEQTSLQLYNVKSKKNEKIINVPYSNPGSNKLTLDMSSETIYACAGNNVYALSFNKDKVWSMPLLDPTSIVLVEAGEKNRMILVLSKNQHEIYRVSENEVIRVKKIEEKERKEKRSEGKKGEEEEEGEVKIEKLSTLNRMTYNAELKQLFVQTSKNVISVYDTTY